MPSGLIDEKDGMGSRCDGVGDFGQMQVHRLGIAGRQDQGSSLSLLRADGSEDVGRGGALIPRSARASAALRPPAGDLVFLGYRKLSARPRHHAQAEGAIENFKKNSQRAWMKSHEAPGS